MLFRNQPSLILKLTNESLKFLLCMLLAKLLSFICLLNYQSEFSLVGLCFVSKVLNTYSHIHIHLTAIQIVSNCG